MQLQQFLISSFAVFVQTERLINRQTQEHAGQQIPKHALIVLAECITEKNNQRKDGRY